MTYSWHVFDWMAYKLRAGYEARQHHQLERNAMTQHQTESRLEELIGKIDRMDERDFDGSLHPMFTSTLAEAWPALRAELSRLREALADQEEQLAFRQPSAVERDMQEVMRINNELLARAEAAEAKLSTMEWQPIETAPKDGTRFLAYVERDTRVRIAKWLETNWYADGGFIRPTYWMPQPTPPGTAGEKDEGNHRSGGSQRSASRRACQHKQSGR